MSYLHFLFFLVSLMLAPFLSQRGYHLFIFLFKSINSLSVSLYRNLKKMNWIYYSGLLNILNWEACLLSSGLNAALMVLYIDFEYCFGQIVPWCFCKPIHKQIDRNQATLPQPTVPLIWWLFSSSNNTPSSWKIRTDETERFTRKECDAPTSDKISLIYRLLKKRLNPLRYLSLQLFLDEVYYRKSFRGTWVYISSSLCSERGRPTNQL